MTKLKKYRVSVPYYATIEVDVIAKDERDAAEKAVEKCWPTLCCYCSKSISIDEHRDDIMYDEYEVSRIDD